MHNVNVDALKQTIAKATQDPSAVKQTVSFDGEWQAGGGPQFTTAIPVPNGEPVTFRADFPSPMGGTGSAPNPLATTDPPNGGRTWRTVGASSDCRGAWSWCG